MPSSPSISLVRTDEGAIRAVPSGGYVDDPTPIVRVSTAGLSAGDSIQLEDAGQALGSARTVTADDLSAGWLEITTPALADGGHDLTAIDTAGGVASAPSADFLLHVDTQTPQSGMVGVYSDAGLVARDGATVDRTLELRGYVGGTGASAVHVGDTIQFYGDDQTVGPAVTVTQADVDRGYVSFTTAPLATGDWYFRAMASDAAGNAQTSFATWHVQEVDKAPPAIVALADDVGTQTGALAAHAFTDDATLTAHVSLADTHAAAGDTLVVTAKSGAQTAHVLSAQDVATGAVDMSAPTLAMDSGGWDYFQTLSAKIQYADGTTGLAQASGDFRLALNAPHAPTIDTAADDAGSQTGALYPAATTDDHTPTFNLTVDTEPAPAWQPPPPPADGGSPGHPMPPPYVSATVGAPVELFANGVLVGQGTVTQDQHLSITTTDLAAGTYTFTAEAVDLAGNVSSVSNSFQLTIADSTSGGTGGGSTTGGSGQSVGETSGNEALVGAAGDDTLTAVHGGDTLTGNGGADHFAFAALPWSPSEVTDFAQGTDKLDLSALLQASGYTGSDPIGDGYVKLIDDGAGGSWLYYDTDGHGSADQWGTFVATLDHVAAASIADADLVGASAGDPSGGGDTTGGGSPGSGGSGQAIGEASGNEVLTGGAGDDTLTANHGGDTLTGAGGADHFAFSALPWSPSEVTDFAAGTDKLDLAALLQASGYAGSDPIGDGYVKPIDDGAGGTWLYFDTDGRGSADPWGSFVATLDHVAAASITDADLVGGSAGAGGGDTAGGGGDTTGSSGGSGQAIGETGGGESLVGGAGDDTLTVDHGGDTVTGAGGADRFAFASLPWSPSEITDFTAGADRIDLSALARASGYAGTDPLADGYVKLIDDGSGGAWLYYDTDGHGTGDQWGVFLATLDHVAPSSLSASDFVV